MDERTDERWEGEFFLPEALRQVVGTIKAAVVVVLRSAGSINSIQFHYLHYQTRLGASL